MMTHLEDVGKRTGTERRWLADDIAPAGVGRDRSEDVCCGYIPHVRDQPVSLRDLAIWGFKKTLSGQRKSEDF